MPVQPQSPSERLAVIEALERQDWIFAKTMPDNPHWYALRKKWKPAPGSTPDEEFERVVLFIRVHGYAEWWPDPINGRAYVVIDLNGYHYWTMGDRMRGTILINRKPL